MEERVRTRFARRGAAIVVLALLASTSCLPVPAATVAAACGDILDSNDPSTYPDESSYPYLGFPEAWSETDAERVSATLFSLSALIETAVWPKIVSISLAEEPGLVVGLDGELPDVRFLLTQFVPNPELLAFVDASAIALVGRAVVAAIEEQPDLSRPFFAEDYQLGPAVAARDATTLAVSLPLNRTAAVFATGLLSSYPGQIELRLGGKIIGPDDVGALTSCLQRFPNWVIANTVPDGVSVRIKLDRATVQRGEAVTGAILVTNRRREPLPVFGLGTDGCGNPRSQPVTTLDQQFTVNSSLQGVPHGLSVLQSYLGYTWLRGGGAIGPVSTASPENCTFVPDDAAVIAPGTTGVIPFRADTFSMQPGTDLTLPPGDYYVRPVAYLFAFNLVALPPERFTVI